MSAFPNLSRNSISCDRRAIVEKRISESSIGTSAPLIPPSITSGIPPTSVAIIGRPANPASRREYGKFSERDGRQKMSNAFKYFLALSTYPLNITLFEIPKCSE